MPKKVVSADDDEGCKTGVGRIRDRAGAGQEQARSTLGAGQEQCKSREEARVGQEH